MSTSLFLNTWSVVDYSVIKLFSHADYALQVEGHLVRVCYMKPWTLEKTPIFLR